FPMTRTSPRSCPSHRSKSVCCVLNPLRSWPCTARFVAKCSKKWLQNPGISHPRSLKPHSAKLLFDSPHIQTLFRQKPLFSEQNPALGNRLCRGQQPPYMQTLVLKPINLWRLLTVP